MPGPYKPWLGLLALALLVGLGGCDQMRHVRLFVPTLFGMEDTGSGLFVDAEMDAATRAALPDKVAEARRRVAHVFGGITTAPAILACASETCFRRFGGGRQRALGFASVAMLLSPRALTPAMIAHEWAHNELAAHLDTYRTAALVPTWFDEGLAVVTSAEPLHGPGVWAEITRRRLPRPDLDSLTTPDQWNRAVLRYGDATEHGPQVTYATAGQAVRDWYGQAGPAGLAALIAAVKAGGPFSTALCRIAAAPITVCRL